MKHLLAITLLLSVGGFCHAASNPISKTPYIGAIVVDVATGEVLFEDHADTPGYPASMVKLMDLLLVLEKVDAGSIKLQDPIAVSKEAARMGGSQVYLAEGEIFPVEDLLYALMIQSANDAAVALAEYVAGSKQKFVTLMNERAAQLGLKATTFESVHGLPPGSGQKPDVSTARDLAALGMALARRPDVFAYTSTKERGFRNGEFIMRSHNKLLSTVDGCDGLKTGYFRLAGFSVIATAERDGRRVIAVVLGSTDRKVRNAEAKRLLEEGLTSLRMKLPASP